MNTGDDTGMGAVRAVSLVTALAFIGVGYLLSGWACGSYKLFAGEGEEGMVLAFLGLPSIAGALALFAMWPLSKGASLVSGFFVFVGSFASAVLGC